MKWVLTRDWNAFCILIVNDLLFLNLGSNLQGSSARVCPAVCYKHHPQGGAQFTNNSLRKKTAVTGYPVSRLNRLVNNQCLVKERVLLSAKLPSGKRFTS